MIVDDVLRAIVKLDNLDPLDVHTYNKAGTIFRSIKELPAILFILHIAG